MIEIKKTALDVRNTVDFNEIIGKKVLAKDSTKVGTIKSIRGNPETLSIEGVIVKKGFFSSEHYIGNGVSGARGTFVEPSTHQNPTD